MKGLFHPDGSFLVIDDDGSLIMKTGSVLSKLSKEGVHDVHHQVPDLGTIARIEAHRAMALRPRRYAPVELLHRIKVLVATVKLACQLVRDMAHHEQGGRLVSRGTREIVVGHENVLVVALSVRLESTDCLHLDGDRDVPEARS